MAYTYDPNLTEEQRQQQAQGQAGQGGGAAAAGGPTPQAGATPKASTSTGGTQSGQFTNLQQYLGANANQQFGSKVAGKVQGDVDTANQTQQQAGQEFGNQVTAGTTAYDQQLADEAKNNASDVYNDESKRNKFTNMRDAAYKGPNALTDLGDQYTKAQGANQNAEKAAQQTQSEEGQKALLGNYYGRPTYSRGETNLDQFLVQNDKSAQPKFQQAREGAGQLQGNFQNLQNTLSGQAQQGAATTQATKDKLNQDFLGEGGAYGQFKGTLQSQADAAKAKADASRGQTLGKLAMHQTADPNMLGQNTWNLDMSKYYNTQDPTLAGTATQQQAGNYGALSNLLGQKNDVFTDPSQVGTYDPSKAVQFNRDQFTKDQGQAEQNYNNAINNPEFNSAYWQNTPDGGMITGALLNKKMGLNEAISKAQSSLNDPAVKGNQKRTDMIYSNLQNLLSQQKGINEQYGANNKLKSTNYSQNNALGIGVR